LTKLNTKLINLKMKKTRLNLIFLFAILTLIILFVYNGFNYYQNAESNNGMIWIGTKFRPTDILKLIGIVLLVSIAYRVIRVKKRS